MKLVPSPEEAYVKLERYCRERQWAGYDPYDALNSSVFNRTPLARSGLARFAFTQLLKRSPVNLRPILGIEPAQNPKALGLFLSAYVGRARAGDATARALAATVAARLLELRSPGTAYWCWGYSFPWQMRSRLVPRFAPNLVCTTFVANALLDAQKLGLGDEFLQAAASAGEYIAKELYWREGEHEGFAYPLPDIHLPVHNANLLGAALLCRLSRFTGDRGSVDIALRVARYSARAQNADGSWPYGVASAQQWIDNFHTGFNLCALKALNKSLDTDEFRPALLRGLAFYRDHFFEPDGVPKYFHNRTYPIDIHAVAQSIITLTALGGHDVRLADLARGVLAWALAHMWDDRGYFYYRVLRSLTIRTPYMRWSQAWMLLALVSTLSEKSAADETEGSRSVDRRLS